MTYQELKIKLQLLTEEQLKQTAVVFVGDDENGKAISHTEESQETFYWMDGDCYGTEETTLEFIKADEGHLTLEDFFCIPKGTITIHTD